MFRIGHGYDVHKFADSCKLIIGGCDIKYDKGLDGHSDADVLVHALMDAMLGALSLGDIGKYFPDNDDDFKGADSIRLLKYVNKLIANNGYSLVNADCTVVAQAPKLAGYIEDMRINISEALGTDIQNISIKATTEEGLGFTGEMRGISSHAVCLLKKNV